MKKENKVIVPTNTEVIKNRDFGRVKGHLTRHQRVTFACFIKNAYLQMLENDNPEQRYFEISLSQFRKEIGVNHRNIFSEDDNIKTNTYSLETNIKHLMTKVLEWRYKDKNGKTIQAEHSVMLSDFKIDKQKQIVRYSLGNFLQDKVLCYGNAYITNMPTIASLKSSYSVALHEQLEQRKTFQKWKVSVKEFRDLMGIMENEYKAIYDFKRKCINPAIKEIEEKTEYFNLKYTNEKSGKTITHFIFTWGFDTNSKHKNFVKIDDEIEDLKKAIFEINNANYKLIDIDHGIEYSEFDAIVENSKGQQGRIKLKNDLEESVNIMKKYIV